MKKYIVVLVVENKPLPDGDYLSIDKIEAHMASRDLDAGLSAKVISISSLDASINISTKL